MIAISSKSQRLSPVSPVRDQGQLIIKKFVNAHSINPNHISLWKLLMAPMHLFSERNEAKNALVRNFSELHNVALRFNGKDYSIIDLIKIAVSGAYAQDQLLQELATLIEKLE